MMLPRLIHDDRRVLGKSIATSRFGCRNGEVFTNLDLPIYEYNVLDSMKTVELILMIEEEFGVKVSPAEFERESWRTPRAQSSPTSIGGCTRELDRGTSEVAAGTADSLLLRRCRGVDCDIWP